MASCTIVQGILTKHNEQTTSMFVAINLVGVIGAVLYRVAIQRLQYTLAIVASELIR